MKLCIDCRHYYTNAGLPLCRHPATQSPVDGSGRDVTCSAMRDGACGMEGRFFMLREAIMPDLPPVPPAPWA
jgi:hypothetical protein